MSTISIILASGFKGATELLVNVVTSGVLEGLFPPFDPTRSPWFNLIEGTAEIAIYLLIAGTASGAFEEMIGGYGLANLPYGSLLMFWLLEGAVAKINHFVGYVADKMNKRRVPVKPTTIAAKDTAENEMSESYTTTSSCSGSLTSDDTPCSQ